MTRREEYEHIFRSVDDDEKALVSRLIDECIFCEEQMETLHKMPQIQINPKNPERMRPTAALRAYKQFSAAYKDNIRILLNVLRKVETTAQDDLLKRLEEFSLE